MAPVLSGCALDVGARAAGGGRSRRCRPPPPAAPPRAPRRRTGRSEPRAPLPPAGLSTSASAAPVAVAVPAAPFLAPTKPYGLDERVVVSAHDDPRPPPGQGGDDVPKPRLTRNGLEARVRQQRPELLCESPRRYGETRRSLTHIHLLPNEPPGPVGVEAIDPEPPCADTGPGHPNHAAPGTPPARARNGTKSASPTPASRRPITPVNLDGTPQATARPCGRDQAGVRAPPADHRTSLPSAGLRGSTRNGCGTRGSRPVTLRRVVWRVELSGLEPPALCAPRWRSTSSAIAPGNSKSYARLRHAPDILGRGHPDWIALRPCNQADAEEGSDGRLVRSRPRPDRSRPRCICPRSYPPSCTRNLSSSTRMTAPSSSSGPICTALGGCAPRSRTPSRSGRVHHGAGAPGCRARRRAALAISAIAPFGSSTARTHVPIRSDGSGQPTERAGASPQRFLRR